MKNNRNIWLILFILVLFACAKDDDLASCDTNEDQLLGCWKTEACTNLLDQDRKPIEAWGKGIYEFVKDGE